MFSLQCIVANYSIQEIPLIFIPEYIQIEVILAIQDEFTEELKNSSSPAYKTLERNITHEVYPTIDIQRNKLETHAKAQ
jgi:hypothetical protein